MAINLASKYSKQIDQMYTHESFVANKANGKYEFTGVKSVKVFSPLTVPLVDYKQQGSNRYGEPQDMQNEVQELIVTQDKSFSLVIDKGVSSATNGTMAAGRRLRQQINEQVTPAQDRYAIAQYIRQAGTVAGIDAMPDSTNILSALSNAGVSMDEQLVPSDGRYCFMSANMVGVLRLAKQIVELEGTGVKALKKGVVGECMGFQIVKVPSSYLPVGAFFLCFRSESVVNPHKIDDTNLHKNPPGISGDLMEGRFLYDAFVLGKKAGGVYAAVLEASKQAAPTISVSGSTATFTSAGASEIKYTTDGSDPRYSESARSLQSGNTAEVEAGAVIRAVAYGTFTSDVTEETTA